ncbi:MAG: hypothetical protein HOL74_03535, partial [Flavobacteriales bacterium]|nr:hypothetical protein [Flavobacteriales bacterium]
MKYKVIIFLFAVFTFEFSYSQATDSIVIDSTLTNSERLFTDSINVLNNQNQQLSGSRNAYNQGLEFVKNEEFEQAIISFTNAINIDSSFSSAYLERAKCYSGTNNELAINDYNSAFALDSLNYEPLYRIAKIQSVSDRKLALSTYDSIIKLDSQQYKAYYEIGV